MPKTKYRLITDSPDSLVVVEATFESGHVQNIHLTHPSWKLLKFKLSLIEKGALEADLDELISLAVANEQHERTFDEDYD